MNTFRQMDLPLRRLDGLVQGDYTGFLPGLGSELGDGRPYEPGDDVRRMDWKLTARTSVPHVRDSIADRELVLWLVVDGSRSLEFGTADLRKRDLGVAVIATLNMLTNRAGNRLGAVTFGTTGDRIFPAQTGHRSTLALLGWLDGDQSDRGPTGGGRDLAGALQAVLRLAHKRGVVAVVSDFMVGSGWEPWLSMLAARHDVLAFELVDPRELALPPVGVVTFVDPETGARVEVQTSSRKVRQRYAELATRRRDDTIRSLRSRGATVVSLSTDCDWVLELAKFVDRRRRLHARAIAPVAVTVR